MMCVQGCGRVSDASVHQQCANVYNLRREDPGGSIQWIKHGPGRTIEREYTAERIPVEAGQVNLQ